MGQARVEVRGRVALEIAGRRRTGPCARAPACIGSTLDELPTFRPSDLPTLMVPTRRKALLIFVLRCHFVSLRVENLCSCVLSRATQAVYQSTDFVPCV